MTDTGSDHDGGTDARTNHTLTGWGTCEVCGRSRLVGSTGDGVVLCGLCFRSAHPGATVAIVPIEERAEVA